MKKLWLLGTLLVVMAGTASSSYAGSERWIMVMTPERMAQKNLVHVRFVGPDGGVLESDALKEMVIREQDCSSGRVFKMVKDYKMGFSPETKRVGIYLFPHVWKSKPLCFSVPNIGKAEKDLTAEENNARSILLEIKP